MPRCLTMWVPYRRHWADAVVVPRVVVSHGEWKPVVKFCHDNVKQWVEFNPGCKIVHGWLVMDLRVAALVVGEESRVELIAHSVVEGQDGKLIDITPVMEHALGTPGVYPFLRHTGTDDEYAAFVGRPLSRVRLYGSLTSGGQFDRMEYLAE